MERIPDTCDIHVFVCTNDRSEIVGNTKPHCSRCITDHDVKFLKEWVRSSGLSGRVVVTKTGCLGWCNFEGGVACVYPAGVFLKGIKDVRALQKIILSELKENPEKSLSPPRGDGIGSFPRRIF